MWRVSASDISGICEPAATPALVPSQQRHRLPLLAALPHIGGGASVGGRGRGEGGGRGMRELEIGGVGRGRASSDASSEPVAAAAQAAAGYGQLCRRLRERGEGKEVGGG